MPRRRHSQEFKVAVVKRVLAGENVRALAKELNIARSKAYDWRGAPLYIAARFGALPLAGD